MTSVIVGKWGKNLAVRVPNEVANTAGLTEGERVEIEAREGDVIVHRPRLSKEAREGALRALEEIKSRRKGVTLGGISIRELIDEGRKR